jgi:hypothetical protein
MNLEYVISKSDFKKNSLVFDKIAVWHLKSQGNLLKYNVLKKTLHYLRFEKVVFYVFKLQFFKSTVFKRFIFCDLV